MLVVDETSPSQTDSVRWALDLHSQEESTLMNETDLVTCSRRQLSELGECVLIDSSNQVQTRYVKILSRMLNLC